MEIELILTVAALLLGKGWLPPLIGWLKRLRSKPLSANNTSVVPSDVRITLKPGEVIIAISSHTGEVAEPPTSSDSADN